jgi:hypothetical protein
MLGLGFASWGDFPHRLGDNMSDGDTVGIGTRSAA